MNLIDFSPEIILYNGRIYTLDEKNSLAQAVAVKDGKLLALGADAVVLPLARDITRLIDLNGKTVIPGIFDSHAHLVEVGEKLMAVRLDDCRSPEEMMEMVRQRAKETPPGHWIIGMGWNEGFFDKPRLPTRHDIDPATDRHPVLLQRFFNADVANSLALKIAGIDRQTPDPPSGKIERDEMGESTGLLRASAKQLVRKLIPPPSEWELIQAIHLGCREMHQYGITSVIDPGLTPEYIRAYQTVLRTGELKVRMNLMPSWHGFNDYENEEQLDYRARETGLYSGIGDEWLRLGGLKMALDGGTTSRTAYMYEPFEGETKVIDYNRLNVDQLLRYFKQAQEWKWDVGIHVTGDRALDMAVTAMVEAITTHSYPDARHNLIHAYMPSDKAIELMAEHKIAAVIQPTFIYWEGDQIEKDVGKVRADNYKPARKLIDRGVRVTASSDVPSTVSTNPYLALYSLVTRKDRNGRFVAENQAINREEALRAYTINGTWLTREEHLKGSLEAGKLADLVVLDRDYFIVPEEEIKGIEAHMTIVGGEIVWEKPGF